jgi:hypothetical protein
MGFRVLVYIPAGGGFGTWAEEVKMSACPASVCQVFPFFGKYNNLVLINPCVATGQEKTIKP